MILNQKKETEVSQNLSPEARIEESFSGKFVLETKPEIIKGTNLFKARVSRKRNSSGTTETYNIVIGNPEDLKIGQEVELLQVRFPFHENDTVFGDDFLTLKQ